MNPLLRSVAVVPLLGLCTALTAQEGGKPTPPAPKTDKVTSQTPPKDQDAAAMAKDPAIKAIDKFISEQKIDKTGAQWKTQLVEPPKQSFDPATDYFLDMQTSVGALRIRLLPSEAPMHVTCGLYLARLGFYDGLSFHRIIPDFMAQGGDPLGSGSGGPGYTIEGEFGSGRKHDKPGLLSTANTGQPKSDGSQFFLTFVKTPWLDNRHTIWGEVVDGMDTVKALEKLGNREGRVANPPKIEKVTVSLAPKAKPADDKAKEGGDKPKEGGDKGK
jgi:peptidyl-prolyl cis-trans isomerase B (cyclophilin B)